MLWSYLVGIGAIVLMALFWTGVQIAWKKSFARHCAEPDVLAQRGNCGGCGGASGCGSDGTENLTFLEEGCHE